MHVLVPGPRAKAATANPGVNWTLTWSDEFDGADGSLPDATKWVHDLGGHGWGNAELQNYTGRTDNTRVEGGNLVIEARREDFEGNAYTSGRLKTQGTFDQTYGKFEARLKLPLGQGIWPAFWTLGSNITTVGWPASGEIDIMEHVNHDLRTIGTLHGPGYNAAAGLSGEYTLPDASFFNDFHTYTIEWGPDVAYWYVDDNLYSVKSKHDVPTGAPWVFNDHPFFMILNVAVGGYWPGNPNATTMFPQQMLVDYVRVYSADRPLEVPTPAPTPTPGPFHGAPAPIPGLIQAEDFDYGGEGVAYHDTDVTNNGGGYRPRESVDIGLSGEPDGSFGVGWAGAGEWLHYAVNVAEGGVYTLETRVASDGLGGQFHIEMDGIDVSGPITVPNTGGWGNWQTLANVVTLSEGPHTLRLMLETNGPTNAVGNFNWLRFTLGEPTPTPTPTPAPTPGPYGPIPAVIPGTVQAEEYDHGGEGVAYHDLDASNNGNQYGNTFRALEAVDIGSSFDTDGTSSIGWVGATEWLHYTVDIASAGFYKFEARVASQGAGGSFHIELDRIDVSGALTVPDTGGWTTWQTVSRNISLPQGRYTLRLVMDTNGSTGGIGNFNWLSFQPTDATPAPTPTPTPSPTPTPMPCTGFTRGVDALGETQAQPWFRCGGSTASYVILHFVKLGEGQQNVQMAYNAAVDRWELTVSGLSNGQTLQYQFTYNDGVQHDTDWFLYTHATATPTPTPTATPTPTPTATPTSTPTPSPTPTPTRTPRPDRQAPRLRVAASPAILFPSNGRLVTVRPLVLVHDNRDRTPTVRLESITCNDRCNPSADIVGAAYGTDDRRFQLRAKKRGRHPRVYTILYSATDDAGNRRTRRASVFVP